MPETRQPESQLPDVLFALDAELNRAIENDQRRERVANTPIALPRRRPRRMMVASFAAAASVAIALLLVFSFTKGNTNLGAQEALGDVAHKIDVAPAPRPDQFQYTKSRATGYGLIEGGLDELARPYKSFISSQPIDTEWWISSTREGRGRFRSGEPTFPTKLDEEIGSKYFDSFAQREALSSTRKDRAQLREINRKLIAYDRAHATSGRIAMGGTEWENATFDPRGQVSFGGELLTPEQLASYPRDPKAMYDRMRLAAEKEAALSQQQVKAMQAAGDTRNPPPPDIDEYLWNTLTSAGNDVPIPTDLRSARVRALAYLPGVTADGTGTDSLGRKGDRFVWNNNGVRYELLFDEKNASLLSSKTTLTDPTKLWPEELGRLPVGFVMSEYQLIEQATVDQLPKAR